MGTNELISTVITERDARGTGRIGMAVRPDARDARGEPRRPPPRASSSDALVAPARAASPRGAAPFWPASVRLPAHAHRLRRRPREPAFFAGAASGLR